ncbi:LLM class flavin-dependent oxidoreductase [Pantoea sp. Z09]|uniref:LLM class flavin-dependent oxidoreductase n=1 Tax=Pantoea sp. Z09 TaxID=2886821 RepID=UPI001EFE29BE|nr:LLM class flavin-dependent oxidoreductase [Pantoea sp. Z09]
MSKQIRFNAFEMNCVGHQSSGLWRHPRDRSWQYKDISYWTDLARLLEQGLFDGIFIADVIGYYDVYGGNIDTAVREASQIPVNDPLQLAAPIAMATQHLGIGITISTTYEHPYTFARRLSTADHLTGGRIGWNIVTSYLDSGARNVGQPVLLEHDARYARAEEYMEVLYKLLEGSWEPDAVVRDRERGLFADPKKVHAIGHHGKFYQVPGVHMSEPSPQRTPLLFQAGSSGAGVRFAARNAESVFVNSHSLPELKTTVSRLRQQVAAQGRDPQGVLVYALITIIVDETDEKAQAKWREYQQYISPEGALALISGWSGQDFSRADPHQPIEKDAAGGIASLVNTFAPQQENWSVQDLAEFGSIGGLGKVFIGSAVTVADALQHWVNETDVDGFNLAYVVAHETFADVIAWLVPELQRRGAYRHAYPAGSTLREKLFGQGPHLPASHPAHQYRDPEQYAAKTTDEEVKA